MIDNILMVGLQATLYQRPSPAFLKSLEREVKGRGVKSSFPLTFRDVILILWSLCVLDVEQIENSRDILLFLVKRSHELLLRDGLDEPEDDEVPFKAKHSGGYTKKAKVMDDVRVVKYRQVRC